MTVMFALGGSIETAVITLAALTAIALPFALRGVRVQPKLGTLLLLGGGVVLGAALWRVAPVLSGDALFHLARVRKLDSLERALAARGRRVRRRRPAPRLRVPALARVPGADRRPRRRRPGARPAARVEHPRAAGRAGRVRGGPRALQQPRGRRRGRRRAGRADLARAGLGRRLQRAGAAADGEPPAARPGRDRALLRLPARPLDRDAARARCVRARDRARAPDLRRLPRRAARRLPRWRARSWPPRRVRARRDRLRRVLGADGRRLGGAAPDRAQDGLARPGRDGASGCDREVPRSARRLLRRQLPARARGLRPGRRDRDRSARDAPAGGARPAAALVGVRARRLARGADASRSRRRSSRPSPTSSRSRRRAARQASCRSRSRSPAACSCWRRCCASGCSRSRSQPGSASSSPSPATSATGSTTAGRRTSRGRPCSRGSAAFAVAAIIRWPGLHERAERSARSRPSSSCCRSACTPRRTGRRPRTTRRTTSARGCSPRSRAGPPPARSSSPTPTRATGSAPSCRSTSPTTRRRTWPTRPRTARTSATTTRVAFLKTGDLSIPRRYGAEWIVINRNRFKTPMTIQPVWQDAKYSLYRLQ